MNHLSAENSDEVLSFISSEPTGPIKFKCHMETPSDVGSKACSNGPGHMTMMATMPIYGKNPLKASPEWSTRRPMTLGLCI